ncbi:MAG: RusA family crossover junction endodeoxyribonuclease, partial [Phycicoccus sp.]
MKAFVNPRSGRAIVTRANAGAQNAWRADVQAAIMRAQEAVTAVAGACSIHIEFVMPRPASLPKRRTPRHTKRPDGDKLVRAIKDALTGVVWADDAQADRGSWAKRYAEPGE